MSEEAIDFKRRARRRLIGAIALVLALVILPPWVMEREPKPTVSNLSVEIPSQEMRRPPPAKPPPAAKPAAEAAQPKPDEKTPDRTTAEAKASGVIDPAAKALKDTGPKKPAEKSAEKAPEKPAPAASDKAAETPKEVERAAATLAGGYAVTVGTFANQDNVKQLQAKLAAEGLKSYTEPVTIAGAQQTRVRAGPFPTREAADKAREKLTAMGLKPGSVAQRQ